VSLDRGAHSGAPGAHNQGGGCGGHRERTLSKAPPLGIRYGKGKRWRAQKSNAKYVSANSISAPTAIPVVIIATALGAGFAEASRGPPAVPDAGGGEHGGGRTKQHEAMPKSQRNGQATEATCYDHCEHECREERDTTGEAESLGFSAG
jgi:hypothetical protein